jgi:hypothetical protein
MLMNKKKLFLVLLVSLLLIIPAVLAKQNDTITTSVTTTSTVPVAIDEDVKQKTKDIYEKVKQSDIQATFFGTEYAEGEPATIWLQLLRSYQPLNNATCYVTAYFPMNHSKFLNSVVMNYLADSDGLYYYDLTAPSTLGVYMLSATCNIPEQAFIDDFLDYSKLEAWENITIQNGKVLLSVGVLELPNYNESSTTNMTGNVLLYHLNEQSGMIIDYSGKGNNGTAFDVSYGVEGKFGTALWFNGVSSAIGVVESDSWKPADSVTVEAWVKFNEIKDSIETVVGGYSASNGYWLGINPQGNIVYFYLNGVYNFYVVYGQGFSNNTWYHLAGTYDRYGGLNNHKIYVNGQVIGQRTSTGAIGNYNQLKIGSVYGTYRFKGTIDEVAIFNRSLFASEISDHYNRGIGISMTNGYIRSKPIVLAGINWFDYFSDYVLNDGSIEFKILDSANNPICSSLGDISSCAGTTSPIKLYAKLTKPFVNSTSPEIDRWWVRWLMPTIEEIRGAGEMRVSTSSSNDDLMAMMLALHSTPVTNQTCDGNHLVTYKSADWTVKGKYYPIEKIETELCLWGCDAQLNACKDAPYKTMLLVGGGIVAFILVVAFLLWLGGVL